MAESTLYVGIDISKAVLEVYLDGEQTSIQVSNDESGVGELMARLEPLGVTLVVLEATGGLERLLVASLRADGIPLALANPRRVRAFATTLGKAKTDKLDAQWLAQYGRMLGLTPTVVSDESTRHLADGVTRRRQVVEMLVAERNRLTRAPASVQAHIQAHIDDLEQPIEALDERIDAWVTQPEWQAKRTVLISVCGIGPVTASVCLAE